MAEDFKRKLVNWLQLAVENGYGDLYYEPGVSLPAASTYGSMSYGPAGRLYTILSNESNWTQKTKDIFERFEEAHGQYLDEDLRIHAYGRAGGAPPLVNVETTYNYAMRNAPAGEYRVWRDPTFLEWYSDEFPPAALLGGLPTFARPAVNWYHPAGDLRPASERFKGCLYTAKYFSPELPPDAILAVPRGAPEYLRYMTQKNTLESAAIRSFESANGDIDAYAIERIIKDNTLVKKYLDRNYLIKRDSYVGDVMTTWRKGQLLSGELSSLNQNSDQALVATKEKVDPSYIIDSQGSNKVGALEHVLGYAINTVNELENSGEADDLIARGYAPIALPYIEKDLALFTQKRQDVFSPWLETKFNTVNLIVKLDIDEQLAAEIPRTLYTLDLKKLWMLVGRGETPAFRESAENALIELLGESPTGDKDIAEKTVRESLVGPPDSKLKQYLEYPQSSAMGTVRDTIRAVKATAATYLLKFFDKLGGPTLWSPGPTFNERANDSVVRSLMEKIFIVNRFPDPLTNNLVFQIALHRSYLDVLPQNPPRMDLYEKTYGAHSYYGEYHHQHVKIQNFKDDVDLFEAAMEKIQEGLVDYESDFEGLAPESRDFKMTGKGAPVPSQFEKFESFIKIETAGPPTGALIEFLRANLEDFGGFWDPNNPENELVFVYNQGYILKGLYAVVHNPFDGTTKKIPLKIGFDKFVKATTTVSAQNISFISNMKEIAEQMDPKSTPSAKSMIQRYILIPPQFVSIESTEVTPGVKTREQTLRERRYLADPKVQQKAYDSNKKVRYYAGPSEFASLERTANRIKDMVDAYDEFVARYGLAELTNELTRCLLEILGLTWDCETKLQMALDYLGVEEFRQTVLVPFLAITAWSGEVMSLGMESTFGKADAALRPTLVENDQKYNAALEKIDSSYATLDAVALQEQFQRAADAKGTIQRMDRVSNNRSAALQNIQSSADFLKEVSEMVDLEEICRNLNDYLMQLIEFLINPDKQDDDVSYKLPKTPEQAIARDESVSAKDIWDQAVKAMKKEFDRQFSLNNAYRQLLPRLLKYLLAICQQVRDNLANPNQGSAPPISRAALAERFPPTALPIPVESCTLDEYLDQLQALIDFVAGALTTAELCSLLEGSATESVKHMVLDAAQGIPCLAGLFSDLDSVDNIFGSMGDMLDPDYCQALLAGDEQLADLCNLPPDAIAPDLRQELQDLLDRGFHLPPPPNIFDDSCDPVVPSERPEGAPNPPPRQPALMDWKNLPSTQAVNDIAIDLYYQNVKKTFASGIANSIEGMIEVRDELQEQVIALTSDDLQAVQNLFSEVSQRRGSNHAADFWAAKKVYIAQKLSALKDAPGFENFITPVRSPHIEELSDHPEAAMFHAEVARVAAGPTEEQRREARNSGGVAVGLDNTPAAGAVRAAGGVMSEFALAAAAWIQFYYTGQTGDASFGPQNLPGVEFLDLTTDHATTRSGFDAESALSPYSDNDFIGFEIKYRAKLPLQQPPLKSVFSYLDEFEAVHFVRTGDQNSSIATRAPVQEFQLAYPGDNIAKNEMSEEYKIAAFNGYGGLRRDDDSEWEQNARNAAELLPNALGITIQEHPVIPPVFERSGHSQFALNFTVTPSVEITDLRLPAAPNIDKFELNYKKSTTVRQLRESLTDIQEYNIKYHDTLQEPVPSTVNNEESKYKLLFEYIDNLAASKGLDIGGSPAVSRHHFDQARKTEYRRLCASYVERLITEARSQPVFSDPASLTTVEFIPKEFERLERSRGFMRQRQPGLNASGLPRQKWIKLPADAPHGDLLGLTAAKEKVKDDFAKNPVCDPVGDPAKAKNLSQLSQASILGIIYLYMRIYCVEFILKMYPTVARFDMLDMFRSNAIPLYITQRINMQFSRDEGFHCDFMQMVSKIMRDRKNRGDTSLKVDPLGGQPIDLVTMDDKLVFLIKEQAPSLVAEFDYIMASHVAEKTVDGSPIPEGWEVLANPALKTTAASLFRGSGDLYESPQSQIVGSPSAKHTNWMSLDDAGLWRPPNDGNNRGQFFFQRYIRVVDSPVINGAVQNSTETAIRNRQRTEISQEMLRNSVQGIQGEAQDAVIDAIKQPDLYGVVNYKQWNRYWRQSVLPTINSWVPPSTYFQKLALGVRLVYLPPSPKFVAELDNLVEATNTYGKIFEKPEFAGPISTLSNNEKAYVTYEWGASRADQIAAVTTTTLPMIEEEYILLDDEYDLGIVLDDWKAGLGANEKFSELQRKIEMSTEYKLLYDYIVPVNRLYSMAFITLNTLSTNAYRDSSLAFESAKSALKSLFYVLLDDKPLGCEDTSVTDAYDALTGDWWNALHTDFGIDLAKMVTDAIIAILAAGINVLGAHIDPFGLIKLIVCPFLPTPSGPDAPDELVRNITQRIKKEWGCWSLPPFPEFPDYVKPTGGSALGTGCPTGQLAQTARCEKIPNYVVLENSEGQELNLSEIQEEIPSENE